MKSEDEFDPDEILSPQELAAQAGIAIGFIRYAIDAGCPTQAGKLSHSILFTWVGEHYNDLRSLMGLPTLNPVDSEGRPIDRLEAILVTLTDYITARTSSPELRREAEYWSGKLKEMGQQYRDEKENGA